MKKLFCSILLGIALLPALAQSSGGALELSTEKKICKGLEAQAGIEFRTQNGVSDMERWTIGGGLNYKINKWLKADVGYSFIQRRYTDRTSNKYQWRHYESPRHRMYGSVTGNWKLNKRWELSVRERYQCTYQTQNFIERYYLSDGHRASDKVVGDECEHLLRTRMQLKWSKKKCNWSPYVNVEALNDLSDHFSLDQMRYTAGTSYKINKHNDLGLSYRFKDKSSNDEDKGHLITLSYTYAF